VPERGGSRSGTFFMAKDPAFLFYSQDFLTGTYTMSCEHVGMYIRLLCLQHQKGRLHELDMLHICTTYVEHVYSKFEKDEEGYFFNKRLKEESEKRKKYTQSRRDNINKRYNKDSGSTYVEHMNIHMENENEDIHTISNNKELSIVTNDKEEVKKEKTKSYKNWSKEEFIEDLKQFSEEYPKDTLNAFFLYWSESSASGKMRFQLEKTWESASRLIRWKESNPAQPTKATAPIKPKFQKNAD
jgi:hypothetical protein